MATPIKAEQGSDEWLQARVGIATASRFTDIMATTRSGYSASRKNYMAELTVEQITGLPTETYKSSAMQWGTDNEPLARLQYELETGNEVEETSLWIDNLLPIGASPDGLIGKDGTLEIKCPNTATHLQTLMSEQVPYQYVAQVQGQLMLTERNWCDFVSYDPRLPENAQMIIIRVERDEVFIEKLLKELTLFLDEVDEQVKFVKEYKNGKD
jgi:putative phage-type endonuclease